MWRVSVYKLTYDEGRCLLTAELSGHWDMDVARRYVAELEKLVSGVKARRRHYRMLIDTTGRTAQSTEIGEYVSKAGGALGRDNEGPLAIVVDSAIFRMQAQRLSVHDKNRKMFTDRQDAMTWLFEDARLPS